MRAMFAGLVLSLYLLVAPAFADDAQPGGDSVYSALKQVELTDTQVQDYIASLNDMKAAMGDAPADAVEPDAKTMAKLDALAKKGGFKDFDDYNTVAGNISLVLDGVDPQTKTYVGSDKLVQRSLDEVKAEKQMPEADKKAAVAELQNELNSTTSIKYKDNIDLVLKHYDKLNAE